MCFIREFDSSCTTKKTNKKLKKYIYSFLNINESRNLTILKYISRSNPNKPFSTSKSFKFFKFVVIYNLLKF
jgi:hypothetical protein